MPDAQGRLSPAEITHVLRWLIQSHGGVPYACPVSGHTDWIVHEYVTQSIIFPVQSNLFTSLSPNPVPVVQLICSGCGYVISLSAAWLGLYPEPTPRGRR